MRFLIAGVLTAAASAPAPARDTEYKLPFADVLTISEAQGKLDGSVKFYLRGQKTPKVLEKKGDDVSNRKTNGVGKDDVFACKWAALSALLALQDKAKRVGANAVVDIVSYYRKNVFSSATDYECHAGAVIVGVTLKGTYAKVAQ
ncbi:MAG: excinuclease ATPase subunit [Lautropia sp. SCN 70-15]|nr:MAG: excinuclease ATPase subunit [Lautropia sp. SCN 70-15]